MEALLRLSNWDLAFPITVFIPANHIYQAK